LLAPAQAGIFGGLFGDKQENATEPEAAQQAKPGFWESLFAKKQANATSQESGPPKPLFGGKMMSGSELLAELRTIRAGLATPSPMQAMSQLFLPQPPAPPAPPVTVTGKGKKGKKTAAAEPAPPPAQKPEPAPAQQAADSKSKPLPGALGGLDALFKLGGVVNDLMVNRLSSQLSYQAMDGLFGALVDQPGSLSKIYVEVPDMSNLTPDLRKRVLNLSAFLVALKASGQVVDASQLDFEAAKKSYVKIMDIRQKAAQMLADAYFKRNQAESLRQMDAAQGTMNLRPEDEAFLQQLGAAKAEDFVKDPRVQAVAVDLLRQSDPDTYGRYTLEFGEMKSHYNGYARAVAGAGAMIGFSYIFANQAATMLHKQGVPGALTFAPLVQQAVPEALALLPRVATVYNRGDESVNGSFSLERAGKVERGLNAKQILAALDEAAKKSLRENLVTSGTGGYLARLHMVSPATAAALADKVVKKETKALLAQHFAADQKQFSFTDAQAGKCGQPKAYKQVTQGLFFQRQPDPDKACNGETAEQALQLAQRDLREGLPELENGDLRKLMYALNANPADAAAPLLLADMQVRIDNLGIGGLLDQQSMQEDRLREHAELQQYAKQPGAKGKAKGHRK
jgi:hypothetical protein